MSISSNSSNLDAKTLILNFLVSNNFDQSIVLPTLKSFSTLVENLINYPFEQKYRQMKTSNKAVQEKFLQHEEMRALILLIGFQDEGEFLILPPTNKDHIISIQDAIVEVINEHGDKLGASVNSSFDPYAEQFTYAHGKLPVQEDKEKYNHLSIDEMMVEEKRKRKELMAKDLPPRHIQIFAPTLTKAEVSE